MSTSTASRCDGWGRSGNARTATLAGLPADVPGRLRRFTVEAIKKIVRGDTCACDIRYRGRDTPDQWASFDGPFNLLVASNLSHLAPDMNLIPGAKVIGDNRHRPCA